QEGKSWLVIMDRLHTLLALVNQGSLMWSSKINLGERQITSEVGKIMAMQGREVDVLLRTYREGRLSEDADYRLARAFWFQLQRWMATLAHEAAQALTSSRQLPETFYWFDQTNSIPEAFESLRTPEWAGQLPFEHPPRIMELDTVNLPNVLDCTAQANNPSFLALRMTALAVARASTAANVWGRHLLQTIRGKRI
ncbi:MAG: hypothetical protein ACYC6L_10735, partial [Anaerolineae bacterium]